MIEDDARSGGSGADYGGPQVGPQPAELIAVSLFGRVARTRTRSALAARGRLVTSPQRQVPPVAKRSLPVGTEQLRRLGLLRVDRSWRRRRLAVQELPSAGMIDVPAAAGAPHLQVLARHVHPHEVTAPPVIQQPLPERRR